MIVWEVHENIGYKTLITASVQFLDSTSKCLSLKGFMGGKNERWWAAYSKVRTNQLFPPFN